jgi:hypothetical protein
MDDHDRLGLGRLEKLDPKTVWKHEARDLTPWVLENIDLLGKQLGIEIQPSRREVPVGSFSLDVLGEDVTGRVVIVENQLEPTNHGHLGQLLVYASGLEAAVVVWLTPTFRDEHRRALDWLNERTDDDVNFFGVELDVVRIGGSPPAPIFRVVAKPNDWQKALKRPEGLTSLAQSRHDFFELVMDAVLAKQPTFHRPKVGYKSWVGMAGGPFGGYDVSFAGGGKFRVETYLDLVSPPDGAKAVFDELVEKDRSNIDAAFPGEDISWERLDGRRASRIALYRETPNFDDEADVNDAVGWAADRLVRFMRFDERFRAAANAVKKTAGL